MTLLQFLYTVHGWQHCLPFLNHLACYLYGTGSVNVTFTVNGLAGLCTSLNRCIIFNQLINGVAIFQNCMLKLL